MFNPAEAETNITLHQSESTRPIRACRSEPVERYDPSSKADKPRKKRGPYHCKTRIKQSDSFLLTESCLWSGACCKRQQALIREKLPANGMCQSYSLGNFR